MNSITSSIAFAMAMGVLLPKAWAQTDPEVRPRQSQDVRADKQFGVGLGLGLFVTPISGQGLLAHYNLSSLIQFELGLWSGTWDATELLESTGTVYLTKFDVNASLNQIRAKYFLGNSFYFAAGLGQRQIEFDLAARSGSTSIQENLKADTTQFNIALGNTWCWDSGFFIGGEWLAVSIPLASSVSTGISSQGAQSADIADLENDAQDTAKTLSEATTAGVATLHLGWQF